MKAASPQQIKSDDWREPSDDWFGKVRSLTRNIGDHLQSATTAVKNSKLGQTAASYISGSGGVASPRSSSEEKSPTAQKTKKADDDWEQW